MPFLFLVSHFRSHTRTLALCAFVYWYMFILWGKHVRLGYETKSLRTCMREQYRRTWYVVVVVVVVDSHIERIILATEETTVTHQVSHRLSNANPACGHKEVPRLTSHIMMTTRYSDHQGSKSRQKAMRLYKQWHRPMSKRFIRPPSSITRATSIDSDCFRLPTTSVLSNKPDKLRSNQF